MTKAQEREALKQIAAIIESTGKDSYLSMTFAGILEQAEENISNDAGCNYKEAYENALDRVRALQAEINESNKSNDRNREDLENKLALTKSNYEIASQNYERINEEYLKTRRELEARTEEATKAAAEIITLKAKLYDLMTK
jgi:RNA recognition motif-containing protein